MKLSGVYGSGGWVGERIRDRIDMKDGVVTGYSHRNETVTIKFEDGEVRTVPHFRDPKQKQPFGAFYTNRYWDGPFPGSRR